MNQIVQLPKRSLVDSMAAKYDMEPGAFVNAIKATVIKGDCSNEQFAAFLMVAKEYDLNPLTKEIYAFPDRGGITPIVSIDGWMNLINSHPQFDGMEFTDTHDDSGKLSAVECRMFRKDRNRPVSVIEYMSECFRQTDPWKKWPNRMLRHKAAIQCARYAFGFSGIMEPDEYERMKDVTPAHTPSVMERLTAGKDGSQSAEGFNRSFVSSEAAALTSGQEIQKQEPSDPTSDVVDVSNGDIDQGSGGVAATAPADTADEAEQQEGGDNPGAVANEQPAPPSEAISPAIRELKRECLDKFLFVATDPNVTEPTQRRGILEKTKDAWKPELPDHLDFVRSCFEMADKVIKGELQVDAARRYLEAV